MSVIENALRKLQARRDGTAAPASQETFGSVTPADPAARRDGAAQVTPARTIVLDQNALRAAGLLPPEHQERELAQQYRQIKRPLINQAIGRGTPRLPRGNLIMVASAVSGEGKTFISLNLACSMGLEPDLRVLLVDGDVINPRLSKLLGVDQERGLLDAIRDPAVDVESCVMGTNIPGLSFLPAGQIGEHATELLASVRMSQVVTRLTEQSNTRLVLFDSPPLLLTTESHALAQVAGQIVLVVRSDQTAQGAVIEAVEKLGEGKSISLILNQSMRPPNAGYYYSGDTSNEGTKNA